MREEIISRKKILKEDNIDKGRKTLNRNIF